MTRFSIFLPVRNGWPHVRECVESVLAQAYPHFLLHVLDNQSSDETVAYLRSVGDERIRLVTSDAPLSIEESWARIRASEKEEFMTTIGHDDLLDPGFLAAIKALIERHPDAALYTTGSRLINDEGKTIRSTHPVPPRETPAEYLTARFTFRRDNFGTGFVMRSADYDRVGGIPKFERLFFADDALWLALMKDSYKACDPAELFSIRIHPKSESASLPSAWGSILRSLQQFTQYLRGYVQHDEAARRVAADLEPGFLLTYHRNAYIFALVEASQAGRRIPAATRERIVSSLEDAAPSVAGRLRRSPKVALVEALNASPLRAQVPHLWSAYYRLRTRAS